MVTNNIGTQFMTPDNQRPDAPLLEVKSLSVDYQAANGTVHAVTDVSFTLQRGEVLGLAGESGSGKSTLAYAIARLLRSPASVTRGEIWYYPRQGDAVSRRNASSEDVELKPLKGQEEVGEHNEKVDILELSSAQLRAFRWRELSIVFQSAMNALNPVATIESQVRDVLKAHSPTMTKDMCKLRALELLRLVGIASDRLRSYPHELSGGMRQRAIIAIALALSPEIIIMDEPTTALDVVVQRDILNEIMSLRHRLDFSVIFITHDLSLLLEMTDKVAIMYAGRIVEMASQHELYTQPRHPYTIGLLNSFPTLHGPRRRMSGIPGTPPDLRSVPAGCAFHPRCHFAFAACWHTLPALAPPAQEVTGQKVACHLYDHTINPASIPTDLRERYLAAANEDEIELDKPATVHPHPTIPTGKGEAQ